jgi:hypothetical protein
MDARGYGPGRVIITAGIPFCFSASGVKVEV